MSDYKHAGRDQTIINIIKHYKVPVQKCTNVLAVVHPILHRLLDGIHKWGSFLEGVDQLHQLGRYI